MVKDKLRGLLALEEPLNYEALAAELDTPVPKLKAMARSIAKEQLTQEIVEIAQAPDETQLAINPETGVIEVIEPAKVEEAARKARTTPAKFRAGTDGLRLLNEEVQAAAGTLVTEITECIEAGYTDANGEKESLAPKDLAALASSLASIQNAFFNKPTTNVQVNTVTSGGTSLLTQFKDELKA